MAIYNAIFKPKNTTPQNNLNLQTNNPTYTTNELHLTLKLVILINNIKDHKNPKHNTNKNFTAEYISKTYNIIKYITKNKSASLNLHPSIYF